MSTTRHFTIMINAILTATDHPPPLQFNPNSIKDVATADPASGIDLIEPPSANSRGTAELSYPIRLPRGRGSFSPQLVLTYSSSRSNGWLGIGWDLDVPRIEIDTRWGVPAYEFNQGVERDRFLLNGAALVPVDRDPRASCRTLPDATVDKQFAPRIETFQRILRCRIGAAVHWEVTAKDGTRFEYGTDDESRLTSYQANESSHTAVWFLRRVIDPNENSTEYRYLTDPTEPGLAIPGFRGEPFVQKYLKQVVYTSHPDAPAAYTADLTSDCGSRQDLIATGRVGFKVMTRCRLSQIDVKFRGELIRRYFLDYNEGAFGKSLLSQVRVTGSDGSAFYEHRFEYTQPEFRDSGGNAFADTVPWPLIPSGSDVQPVATAETGLSRTSETDHLFQLRAGIGFSVGSGSGEAGCEVGVNEGLNFGHPRPQVQHIDVNGDSVTDRLWTSGSGIRAALGQVVRSGGNFTGSLGNAPISIRGLTQLGSQDEIGGLLGVDGSCMAGGASVGAGLSFSVRKSDANSLLVDADGDGRVDLTRETACSRACLIPAEMERRPIQRPAPVATAFLCAPILQGSAFERCSPLERL
jgi:Salmonella virulence plasmid 65kDa B protein